MTSAEATTRAKREALICAADAHKAAMDYPGDGAQQQAALGPLFAAIDLAVLAAGVEQADGPLADLIKSARAYMEYHGRKYSESGIPQPTGLWPAIEKAEQERDRLRAQMDERQKEG